MKIMSLSIVRMQLLLLTLLIFGHGVASKLRSFDYLSPNETQKLQQVNIGAKKCMDDLGCFEVTKDFFHVLYRPINFLPYDRKTIGTRFALFTKEHPKEQHYIHATDVEEIKKSSIDSTHKTVFIVHGFFDSRLYGKWMEEMKDNLLLHREHNVIIVDWSKGNGAPYTQASANSRVVGAEIAFLIQKLQELKGVSPMDCHIIGHSLGAHIAGYAGLRLKKLGRISALDPAQPYFQNMPPSVRLDATDADFVDVIHTDSASFTFLALGMSQTVGHVDFYPNNGMSQPGCSYAAIYSIFLEGLIDAARRFVACNHQRAVDFYQYSINYKKALPVAYHCEKWEDYLDGQCTDCGQNNKHCTTMGYKAISYRPYKNDSKSMKMFLTTDKDAPYFEYTYQIKIRLRKPKTSFQDRNGEIFLTILSPKSPKKLKYSTKSGKLIHGATYTFLERRQEPLGEITGISFSWRSSSWNILSTHVIYLDYVSIAPMNTASNAEQKAQTKKFCDNKGVSIKSQNPITLKTCKE